MADKNIKIAVVLTAVDKMTAVINKANKNAKAAFSVGKTSAITGTALAAPLIYATNKAMEFEDTMADVAKAFGTKIGDSSFNQLGNEAQALGVYLAKTAEESSALMASLGQGGVSREDLTEVARTAGQISVAFELSADAAGDSYTKLKNALNSSWKETKVIGDAINNLSDNQASKAAEILTFMASGAAGVSKSSKTAGKDMAAMGSYLISVGKSGEESSTIMERFYKGIMKNAGTRAMFLKSGQGAQGFLRVLEKGANIKDPGKQFEYFKQFGDYSTEIMAMAGNMDQLKSSLASVSDETKFLGSIQREFENRSSTTKFSLNQNMVEFNNVVTDFGANGLPILVDLLKTVNPIVKSVGEWMNNNKELTASIFKGVAGLAAMSFAVSGGSFVLGGLFKTFGAGAKVFSYFGTSVNLLGKTRFGLHMAKLGSITQKVLGGFKIFGQGVSKFIGKGLAGASKLFTSFGSGLLRVFKSVSSGIRALGPMFMKVFSLIGNGLKAFGSFLGRSFSLIGRGFKVFASGLVKAVRLIGAGLAQAGRFLLANPIILIIAGIAVAAYLIYKYWEPIKKFFIKLWDTAKKIFSAAWSGIKNVILNYTPHGLIFKNWGKITEFFTSLWAGVKTVFFKAVSWFIGLHVQFFNAGKNIVSSIWKGIKAMANKPIEAIKAIVKKVRDFLPFSPAKTGPLRDIHKIRLIETIAESIKPTSLIRAVNGVMLKVSSNPGVMQATAAVKVAGVNRTTEKPRFENRSSINFSPVINLSGQATKADGERIASTLKYEFVKLMKEYQAKQKRIAY